MADLQLTHTGAQIDSAVDKGIATADYIVDSGTSGIWTWRKWNSGISECFGAKSFTSAVTSAWGALYQSAAQTENYPSGLFNAAPTVIASPSGNASFLEVSGNGSATVTPTFYVARPVSTASNSYKINIHAIGRWR